MSDWKNRVILNDNPHLSPDDCGAEFVAAIRASQIEANKGWAPDADDLIDRRMVNCPDCGGPGMNTCWGYWAFECGAEIGGDGDVNQPCGDSCELPI